MRPLISPARLVPVLSSAGGSCFLDLGITQLVNGQGYIDVVFASAQPDTDWDTQCSIVNTTDATPLNIWPGIVTAKATTGFTLQLNGAPDSSNYFLHWAITPGVPMATTYTLSGPSSGKISIASTNFTVALPGGGSVAGTVTVTPSDGGAGGTFTPATVNLTTAAPSATFTYTPASYGAKTISVTNSGGLTNPANLTYTSVAATYTLTGPSSGAVSVASTNFTIALPAGGVLVSTVTVTPNDSSGGGTFTPTTVGLTTGAPSATFTYTPASAGVKTIGVSNSGGLTNPASLTYTVAAAPHLLDTLISYWKLDEASTASGFVGRNDSVGTNHFTEVIAFSPSGTGKINNALNGLGAGGYLTAANNASLQVTGDFTFSLWVKVNANGGMMVFSKGDYQLYYDAFTVPPGGYMGFQFSVSSGPLAQVGAQYTAPGPWVHVVCWYDSSDNKVRMRINDTTTYVSPTSAALSAPGATALFLLANTGGAQTFNGLVDEWGFWKRKLTAAEITALYNGGAGLPFSSFTA